jgi:threonylcarbamoyladenosine tRNA methylthiotransferase MtaB
MKTVKFFTLGCKVNQYETQAIREKFIGAGFREINAAGKLKSDVCVINTCTVTQRADRESLNSIRRLQRQNPAARIVVTGCLAELDVDKIKTINAASLVVRNNGKAGIVGLLNGSKADKKTPGKLEVSGFSGHTRAFLKIQDGCNNFCSYCKVPLVRGKSKSRPPEEIINEAGRLVNKGFKEIVLTGICLGSYGKDMVPRVSLVSVINNLEKLKGLLRLRLSSIEAGDISAGLLNTIAHSKIVCPHLHIPLQSGDNRILKAMNRGYSDKDYLGLIKKIKALIPGVSITTDVLVGYPGETEDNFKQTLRLVEKIQPLKVHIFPYSFRKGTAASRKLSLAVEPSVIKARMQRLGQSADKQSLFYKRRFLGKRVSVLFESKCKDNLDYWEGYTGNYIKARIRSKQNLKNRLACVTLDRIGAGFVYAGKMKLLTK